MSAEGCGGDGAEVSYQVLERIRGEDDLCTSLDLAEAALVTVPVDVFKLSQLQVFFCSD